MLHDLRENAAIIENLATSSNCPLPYRNASGELDAFEIKDHHLASQLTGKATKSGLPLIELDQFIEYLSTPEGRATYLQTQHYASCQQALVGQIPRDELRFSANTFYCSHRGKETSVYVLWVRYQNQLVLIGEDVPTTHPNLTTYQQPIKDAIVDAVINKLGKGQTIIFECAALSQLTRENPSELRQSTPAFKLKVQKAAQQTAQQPIEVIKTANYRQCSLLAPKEEAERFTAQLTKVGYRTTEATTHNTWVAATLWNASADRNPTGFAQYLDKGVAIFDDRVGDTPTLTLSHQNERKDEKGYLKGIHAIKDLIANQKLADVTINAVIADPLNFDTRLKAAITNSVRKLEAAIQRNDPQKIRKLMEEQPWLTTPELLHEELLEDAILTYADLPTAEAYFANTQANKPHISDSVIKAAYQRAPNVAFVTLNHHEIRQLLTGTRASTKTTQEPEIFEIIAQAAVVHPKRADRLDELGKAIAGYKHTIAWSQQTLEILAPHRKLIEEGIQNYTKYYKEDLHPEGLKLLRDLATAAIKQASQEHRGRGPT